MEVLRLAAFSQNGEGGNPAGVKICDEMPTENEMSQIAKQVGYSETAFLKQVDDGWRVRYFSPQMEIPFCGHATIASGAVLGERFGEGVYRLFLNEGEISVSVVKSESGIFRSTLTSPQTWSETAPIDYVARILKELNLSDEDLDGNFPANFAFAGAKHIIIALKKRQTLADIAYDFARVNSLMQEQGLVTINLIWQESNKLFHSRNLFPPGGVYEDPATGAAAAALAGYLRDIQWQGDTDFDILQGEDMGKPSRLSVQYTHKKAEAVKVAGETRYINEEND